MMKKIFTVLSLSSFLLLACGDGEQESESVDEASAEESDSELLQQIEDLENEIEVIQSELDEQIEINESYEALLEGLVGESSPNETAEEVSDSQDGSRSSPVPVGVPLTLTATVGTNEITFNVTVISTTRGQEAWDIVYSENQFNDAPNDGQEYIINEIEIEVLESSDSNLSTDFSYREFDYFTNEGSNYQDTYPLLPNRFDFEIFEGGSANGYIGQIVNVDDSPTIRYGEMFFFESE